MVFKLADQANVSRRKRIVHIHFGTHRSVLKVMDLYPVQLGSLGKRAFILKLKSLGRDLNPRHLAYKAIERSIDLHSRPG